MEKANIDGVNVVVGSKLEKDKLNILRGLNIENTRSTNQINELKKALKQNDREIIRNFRENVKNDISSIKRQIEINEILIKALQL